MRSVARLAYLLVVLAQFVGCGGGGGGSSGPPPPPPGSFTLSGNSATFSALQLDATPAEVDLALTLTSSGAAFVGAAYVAPATQPGWLGIAITGSGNDYVVHLSITTTNLAPGAYTSTFSVGTADANQKILASQQVTVNYTVTGRISLQASAYVTGFTYGQSQSSPQITTVAVTGNGRTWTAASDSSWLTVPATSTTGDAIVAVTIDPSALMPGTYTGHLTVTDSALATNTASTTYTITVAPPVLTVTAGTVLLGGADGLSSAPAVLTAALNTGGASYPYTVTLSTVDGGGWLHVDTAAGSLGAASLPLTFSGDRTTLLGGTYTGQVTITVTVKALTLTEVRPVTFNVEANRIVVAAAGVGFVSMPSGSVLTRAVRVYSTLGRTNVPWTATSDSAWLTATASGVTGGDITLTANPAGLPADTTQFATVTVSSSDASVENQQTIRVGLNLRSANATATAVTASGRYLTTSPVEPIAFVVDNAGQVVGYDVRDGTVKRTFTGVVNPGALVTNGDGTRLYVSDLTNQQVVELDAVTGAIIRTYAATPAPGRSFGFAIGFIRTAGYALLVTPSGRVYDVASGAAYDDAMLGSAAPASYSLANSPDQTLLVPDFANVYRLTRTALNGGGFSAQLVTSVPTEAGRQGQACVARDGDRIYTASGGVYNFPGYSLAAAAVVQVLPGSNYPDAVLCLWNGIVIGGATQPITANDVWVYDGPSGTSLGLLYSAQETNILGLVDRGAAVSADGGSLVTLTRSPPGVNIGAEVYFQPLPAPL